MVKTPRSKRFLDAVVRHRARGKDLDNIFKNYEKAAQSQSRPRTIKGVHNGQYFRITVPPKHTPREMPKLPSPTGPVPFSKPLQMVPPAETSHPMSGVAGAMADGGQQQKARDMLERMVEFLKLNWDILIMNLGSFCTLLAFTRTDVLELRSLSVTGSLCFIVYNFASPPVKWLTVGWTSLFTMVNSWKIAEIINERHSHFDMTPEQQHCFTKYFATFGITPKQFESITKSAERVIIPKNKPLIMQGQKLEHVYLIVEGSTRASILGRYLTAASTTAIADETRGGGKNSGAWIGEMAFLESIWDKDTSGGEAVKIDKKTKKRTIKNDNPNANSMYTVVATEDCVVWRWTHADMEKLMNKSPDLRDALTRAMTSAIVGKVINFTVSRSSARPTWQTWLDNFKAQRAEHNITIADFHKDQVAAAAAGAGDEDVDHDEHHHEMDNDDDEEHAGGKEEEHHDAPKSKGKKKAASVGKESPA